MFEGSRDALLSYGESNVTTNTTSEVIHMPAVNECNILVETQGLEGDAALSIKFEESDNGTDFTEVGTFPVHESRYGILFAKRKNYVRYTLQVSGTSPSLTVAIKF